jgi:hypothetical protein
VVIECACTSSDDVSDVSCVAVDFAVAPLAVISEVVVGEKLVDAGTSADAVDEVIEEDSARVVGVVVETVVVSWLATVVCAGKLADVVAAVEDASCVIVVSNVGTLVDNSSEVDCPRLV